MCVAPSIPAALLVLNSGKESRSGLLNFSESRLSFSRRVLLSEIPPSSVNDAQSYCFKRRAGVRAGVKSRGQSYEIMF